MAERPHSVDIYWGETPELAAIAKTSLAPEAADLHDERSSTSVQVDGDEVHLEIRAADLTALRAAVNTWLGLLRTVEDTMEAANQGY